MQEKKKMRREKRKKKGGEKAKSKSQDCCVTFRNARTSQADVLRPPSVRPVNRFVVSFSSL